MQHGSTWVGLDAHKETITGAAITGDGEIRNLGTFPNHPEQLTKRVDQWGDRETMRVCYEAGPCGYGIARQLERMGIACMVVAPALIPRRPGDRIKNDRRDAVQLAELLRGDLLTAVPVPSREREGLRALSRAREQAVRDQHRQRQRLLKFLTQHGVREPSGTRWTQRWWRWLEAVTVPEATAHLVLDDARQAVRAAEQRVARLTEALLTASQHERTAQTMANLQGLHGIGAVSAAGIIAEAGELTRFTSAPAFMAYTGVVPREHSSGARQSRGSITRTGNAHLRFLLVEAAWQYTRPRNETPPPTTPVERIAQRARVRLHRLFWKLVNRGKPRQVAIIAVARELAGFIWAVGQVDQPA
jgi:transposase